MNFTTAGEILQDTKNGKERPWREKKMKSTFLSQSFHRLDMHGRGHRVFECGSFLKFAECAKGDYKKLVYANFCRDRLCPMCNWRRSRKLQKQIYDILHAAVGVRKMRFIFLTLTVKNVPGEGLNDTITAMLRGFNELTKLKEVDSPVIGYVRTLEVTFNKKRDDYHPHIHALLAVEPSYFSTKYISHARWLELWKGLLNLDYEPIVDIRTVKQRSEGQAPVEAAMEIGKYGAKDKDYINEDDTELSDRVTSVLSTALKSRRLIGFGKLFRKLHKQLNLSDVESDTSDLVGGEEHNCTCPLCSSNLFETLYKWHIGCCTYISE